LKVSSSRCTAWLLVGAWTYEADATLEPGQPPSTCKGSEGVRSLGGLWMLAEGPGEMPGDGAATTVLTLVYDPQQQRYMGTWIGSMMTYLWGYDGALDAAGRMLSLNAAGPEWPPRGRWRRTRTGSRSRAPITSNTGPGEAMQVQPYLFFDGRCEEAVACYRRALGAKVSMLVHFKDSHEPMNPAWSRLVPGTK
jgi:Protein of unknown function (DUF1579)